MSFLINVNQPRPSYIHVVMCSMLRLYPFLMLYRSFIRQRDAKCGETRDRLNFNLSLTS